MEHCGMMKIKSVRIVAKRVIVSLNVQSNGTGPHTLFVIDVVSKVIWQGIALRDQDWVDLVVAFLDLGEADLWADLLRMVRAKKGHLLTLNMQILWLN
jgi:hypothetical protein